MDFTIDLCKALEECNSQYKDFLLLKIYPNKEYLVVSNEEKSIIYRDGYIEAGGNFKVYKNYKGIWNIYNEGFGSPTYYALFIGGIKNIISSVSLNNIIDLYSGEVVISKGETK